MYLVYPLLGIFLQGHFLAEQEVMKGRHQISLILMRKSRLPHKQEKPDTVAAAANQMAMQIALGGGEGQAQGIHDLRQTTQMCLIECHRHHHQAEETGMWQFSNLTAFSIVY